MPSPSNEPASANERISRLENDVRDLRDALAALHRKVDALDSDALDSDALDSDAPDSDALESDALDDGNVWDDADFDTEAPDRDVPDVEDAEARTLRSIQDRHSRSRSGAASDTPSSSPSFTERTWAKTQEVLGLNSEDWLSRVGIGLLLIGLLFLFDYSIEQGWIGPAVRVGFGGGLGGLLLWGGIRTIGSRHRIGQILLGGSSATFYATLYAAYALYALLPYSFAFAAMVTVTVLTVALALSQDEASLGFIGVVGGLATPFLLYTSDGSLPGLLGYTGLIQVAAGALFLYRGWRSVLVAAVVGGWLILVPSTLFGVEGVLSQIAAVASAVLTALLHGGLPVVRSLLRERAPDRWPDFSWRWTPDWLTDATRPQYASLLLAPFLFWGITEEALEFEQRANGIFGYALAAAYVGFSVGFVRASIARYARACGLAASVLATAATVVLLDDTTRLAVLAVQGVGYLAIARRSEDVRLMWVGRLLLVGVAMWLVDGFTESTRGIIRLVSAEALSELFVVAMLAAGAFLSRGTARWVFAGIAYAEWLVWAWHELVTLPNGQAYISAIWGATALATLVAASVWRSKRIQYAGLATLALFVAKLFLVDLGNLSPLWRIVLFLASGGLLLLVSYLAPNWFRIEEPDSVDDATDGT